MPEWFKWTAFALCLPAIGVFGFKELQAYKEGLNLLASLYVFLQCGVALGMLYMAIKWWPTE